MVGPPIEVGLMNTDCGWDFYKQTALSEMEGAPSGCCSPRPNATQRTIPAAASTNPVMNGPSARLPGCPRRSDNGCGRYPTRGRTRPAGIGGIGLAIRRTNPTSDTRQFLRLASRRYFDDMVEGRLVTSYQQWTGDMVPAPPFSHPTWASAEQGEDRGWRLVQSRHREGRFHLLI